MGELAAGGQLECYEVSLDNNVLEWSWVSTVSLEISDPNLPINISTPDTLTLMVVDDEGRQWFPPGEQRRGVEHLQAVHALAHTLVAYTTVLCCMNTVKRGCCTPLPPFGGNTGISQNSYPQKYAH